jgi:hypothetical protein
MAAACSFRGAACVPRCAEACRGHSRRQPTIGSVRALAVGSSPPVLPDPPSPPPLKDTELFLLAGRVFLSSAYLATETLVGGNLWFTVGTSATGLLASMVVARQQGRSGSP